MFQYKDGQQSSYDGIWMVPNVNFDVNFKRISFYLSDTATFGKLNVNLGVRYDKESGGLNGGLQKGAYWYEPGSAHHMEKVFWDNKAKLGDLMVPKMDAPVSWKTISPRLSLTYDISGDGKNVVKLSMARYGSQSGNALAGNLFPYRETDFYWFDKNNDFKPQWNEVMNGLYYYMANNYGDTSYSGPYQNWTNTQLVDYTKGINNVQYNKDYNTPLLDELTLTFEKALGADLAISLSGIYRKRHNLVRTIGIMDAAGTLETAANWYLKNPAMKVGTTTVPMYYRKVKPIGTYYTNYTKDKETFMAATLSLTKKMSSKWMADASFTFQDWKASMDKAEHFNLNNFDYFDGGVVAPETSGSGLTGIFINARWMFKLSGLYQLPWGLNLSAVFQAREGYVIPYRIQTYVGSTAGTSSYLSLYEGGKKFGDDRLPVFTILNLGLEKTFKISDTTNATIFCDWYNVTNQQAQLKVNNNIGPSKDQILMVTNPGNFQFGFRLNF
jgi:hypothetical protein